MRDEIIKFNEDVLPAVYASSNYGIHGNGKENFKKMLSFLSLADIHGDKERLDDALFYLNSVKSLDFGIHLGDIQGGDFAENDGIWYTNLVLSSQKKLYPVMGNHDGGNSTLASLSATRDDVFNKFVSPTKEHLGLPDLNKTYYTVNFDRYKVSLVVLDNYIQPDNRDENGDFLYHRGTQTLLPEQLSWFCDALMNVPKDYHLVIASHEYPEPYIIKNGSWTQEGVEIIGNYEHLAYGCKSIMSSIVDAWINGIAFKAEFEPKEDFSALPTLSVDVDYSKRGTGTFVGYFIGHKHCDIIGSSKDFPYQNIFSFASASSDFWQNYSSDLPRAHHSKAQDCLTVVSIDTENRLVKLVRVGSNITVNLTERKYYIASY